MNNYLKLLLHLKQFEGDGKMHPIEQLFPELSLDEKFNIFYELEEEGLISFTGRVTKYDSYLFEKNLLTGESKITESPFNKITVEANNDEYIAKITFKGSKYLKEELEMQEKGKYNINVSGKRASNTFVIESKNVTIDNRKDFATKIEKIIKTIKEDESIDNALKEKAITDFKKAKKEVEKSGNLPENIMKGILQYGAQIGSIGSLLFQLFANS